MKRLYRHLGKLFALLRKTTVQNFIILACGQYGGLAITIVCSLLLTRLLVPSDFGVIAAFSFLFTTFNWLTDWGWEQALMAHKQIPLNKAASTHLLLRFTVGSFPLIACGIAWGMGFSYITRGHTSILVVLALAYWFEKVGLTYKTILERHSLLSSLAWFEFLSNFTSFVIALFAAWSGLGATSLALQKMVEKLVLACGYSYASPWKIGTDYDAGVAKTFFMTFGIPSWIGGLFSLAMYDFMPFLLAGLVGMHEAGLYAKAFSLGTFPLMLTSIFHRITAPLYTQHQYLVPRLRRCFVLAQTYKAFCIIPLQIMLITLSPWWIVSVFGQAWIQLVPIYQVMGVYGLLRSFFDDVPPLIALGFKKPWELTRNQMIQSMIIGLLGPGLVMWGGALGSAWAMVISMGIGTVLFWRVALRYVRCTWFYGVTIAKIGLMRPGGTRWSNLH